MSNNRQRNEQGNKTRRHDDWRGNQAGIEKPPSIAGEMKRVTEIELNLAASHHRVDLAFSLCPVDAVFGYDLVYEIVVAAQPVEVAVGEFTPLRTYIFENEFLFFAEIRKTAGCLFGAVHRCRLQSLHMATISATHRGIDARRRGF
jgi:hypothetical protein